MQTIFYIIATTLACALATFSVEANYNEIFRYPNMQSELSEPLIIRRIRDVTYDKNVGNGKVFGTMGNNDQGLFGKAGYKQDIFNDGRGRLQGQAYGSRVLGPNGDSSHFGGKLDWSNQNAKAAFDLNKQIGGRTSMSASGGGVWNLNKNTQFSAEGMYNRPGRGKPDYGVFTNFNHRF